MKNPTNRFRKSLVLLPLAIGLALPNSVSGQAAGDFNELIEASEAEINDPDAVRPPPPAPAETAPAAPAAPAPAAPAAGETEVAGEIAPGLEPAADPVIPVEPAPGEAAPAPAEAAPVPTPVESPEETRRRVDQQTSALLDEISAKRITLVEAVRMTLANNPEVQLAVEDANLAKADLMRVQGNFDTIFTTDYSYSNKSSEITDKEKDKERARYQVLRDLYKTSNIVLDRIDRIENGKIDASLFSLDGTPLTDPNSSINNPVGRDPVDRDIDALERAFDKKVEAVINLLAGGSGNAEADSLALDAVKIQKQIWTIIQRNTFNGLKNLPPWIVTRTEAHKYEMALTQRFRGGPELRLYGLMTGNETNVGTRGQDPRTNRTALGGMLSVNVLKMGPSDPAYAQEVAIRQQILAQEQIARARAGSQVLATVQAYWQLAAAQERLEYLVKTEIEAMAVHGLTRKQIDANLLPASEMARTNARLMESVAGRFAGEVELVTAQQALAVLIGVDPRLAFAAPLAAEPLPPLTGESAVRGLDFSRLVRYTLAHHPDLLAFQHINTANDVLVESSRRDLKPDLDIFVGGEFTGYNQETGLEGYFSSMTTRNTGSSLMLGGKFEWPFQNRTRIGSHLEAMTQARKSRLLEVQAQRGLAADLAADVKNLLRTIQQARQISQAADEYEKALASERRRLDLNETTLVDVLFTEQSLSQARLAEVTSKLAHALALANLRFSTFTILPRVDYSAIEDPAVRAGMTLTRDYFIRLPAMDLLELSKNPLPAPIYPWDKPKPLLDKFFGEPGPAAAPPAPAPVAAVPVAKPAKQGRDTPPPPAPAGVPVAAAAPAPAAEPAPAAKPAPLLKRMFGGRN
jgi:outer membrane protein TolC